MNDNIPMIIFTDSYKSAHFFQYPPMKIMKAYGEFRKSYPGINDDRIVYYGMRYIIETFFEKPWTTKDVEQFDLFLKTHNVMGATYPFPKDIFLKFINENNGYFPITLESLPECSVVYPHTPVYQMTASEEYSRLVTFMESLITQYLWYSSTVATLSRHTRQVIFDAFEISVEPQNYWKLDSRLHDFAFRGVTSVEQSIVGGISHLLNFRGSDTMSACYYAQFNLNDGKSVAESIPATEHSVMMSWPTEVDAVKNMMSNFGTGVFATVADTYDYYNFLNNVIPECKDIHNANGGYWVIRPDSGDPTECVLAALFALEKVFGSTVNSKGYKVIQNAGVIQGDGIDINIVKKILDAVINIRFSVENVAFGMGGGLLQKVNRDTLSFATKLCYTQDYNGKETDIFKHPKTDNSKFSLPGITSVKLIDGIPKVFPGKVNDDIFTIVYNCGPVDFEKPLFDNLRSRLNSNWDNVPRLGEALSVEMKEKINNMLK